MSHLSLLPDGNLATVQKKDGANKTDVPCLRYLPDYIKYMRTLKGGSTGGTGYFTFQNAVSSTAIF